MTIRKIISRKIIASTGNYTLEVEMEVDNGVKSIASVPAGISAGKYEVKKVDVDTGIRQLQLVGQICVGKDWTQESLDAELIKSGVGGNVSLAVSAAFYKAGITERKVVKPPKIMLLLFEGGEHGNQNLTIQEFMVIENSVEQAVQDFQALRRYLVENNIEQTVGVEGGFSPIGFSNNDALDTISKVLPQREIALDIAGTFNREKFFDYSLLTHKYNLASLEDPYDDESWDEWVSLTNLLGSTIMIVGDDLITTNPERIRKAVNLRACNAVIIKPDQIGTITLAKQAVREARSGGLKVIVSHRGQETNDNWIVSFALDVEADYVKFGGINRGERVAKYNQLSQLLL